MRDCMRAIELDPFNPSHHGLLAEIRLLKQRNWAGGAGRGGCGAGD